MPLQTCKPEKFCSCRWMDKWMVKRAQTVSEDPHRRERINLTITPKCHGANCSFANNMAGIIQTNGGNALLMK